MSSAPAFTYEQLIESFRESREEMRKSREEYDRRQEEYDRRKFIGAVGGGVVLENMQRFALKHGLYVVMQSGGNVEFSSRKESRRFGKDKVQKCLIQQ